jgi:hypothetical protein
MLDRKLSLAQIERVRAHLWRTAASRQIGGERGALRFIAEQGFVLIIPISGTEMPSVHTATDEDWSVWWDWKQTLPQRKACYYAKLLRRRGTFVDWAWFPHFRAAYAHDRPYWRLYRDGLLDRDQKRVLDLLEANGPMMTTELRLAFGPRNKRNTRLVKQILVDLQLRLLICPSGGDTEGWSHHRWDLVDRWVPPSALAAARNLSPDAARAALIRKFIYNMVATTPADIAWIFGWERTLVNRTVAHLVAAGDAGTAQVEELGGDVVVPNPWPGLREDGGVRRPRPTGLAAEGPGGGLARRSLGGGG